MVSVRNWKNMARTIAFLALCGIIVAVLSLLLTPLFTKSNRVATTGLYTQPQNSIEVGIVGTSTMLSGISPVTLYEQYGVSAYNAANGSQPAFSSYYLLQDMKRLNKDSLKVVVYDPSNLVLDRTSDDKTMNTVERILMNMDFSEVKLRAIVEAAKVFATDRYYELLVPVLRYHSRWAKLTEEDFEYLMGKKDDYSSRGQYVRYLGNVETVNNWPTYKDNNLLITDEKSYDDEHLTSLWDREELVYIDKMVDFCREQGIELVLIQTPRQEWTDEMHDSVKLYAEQNSLPFIDYCTPDLLEELGFAYSYDMVDKRHPNIHGSQKITRHLGSYLMQAYELAGSYPSSVSSLLDECAAQYDEILENGKLLLCKDLNEYLDLLDNDRYTVFVAVREDAAAGLPDETRRKLVELGFTGFELLEPGQPYAGLINNGTVRGNKREPDTSKKARLTGVYHDGKVITKSANMQSGAVFEHAYEISSSAEEAVMIVDGENVCVNQRGINFAVYDSARGELIDTSCFDTHTGSARTSDLENR